MGFLRVTQIPASPSGSQRDPPRSQKRECTQYIGRSNPYVCLSRWSNRVISDSGVEYVCWVLSHYGEWLLAAPQCWVVGHQCHLLQGLYDQGLYDQGLIKFLSQRLSKKLRAREAIEKWRIWCLGSVRAQTNDKKSKCFKSKEHQDKGKQKTECLQRGAKAESKSQNPQCLWRSESKQTKSQNRSLGQNASEQTQ